MRVKTCEFTKTDGNKVMINPGSVTYIEQAENFSQPVKEDGKHPPATAVGCFGYMVYLVDDYQDVCKEIWGA